MGGEAFRAACTGGGTEGGGGRAVGDELVQGVRESGIIARGPEEAAG